MGNIIGTVKKPLIWLLLGLFFGAILLVLFFLFARKTENIITPFANKILEKPLDKYTFKNLRTTKFEASNIKIGKKIKTGVGFDSYVFSFRVNGKKVSGASLSSSKKVSGLLNVPTNSITTETQYPIIVMLRGFVPKEIYSIGEGTRHSGEVFAQNGFITLAPDFLGYGESDNPSNSSLEERFETYTTALTLLASLGNLNGALKSSNINAQVDPKKVGIWGHSNGGQISISTLEITGATMPAVLWAPVSKPFPFSILAFTDDFSDHGKALRKVVADFDKDYDAERYSPNNFYSWVKSPVEIHQGENDESVPIWWSNSLVSDLEKLKIPVTYFTYPGQDHNFSNPVQWSEAVSRSIDFYRQEFEKR